MAFSLVTFKASADLSAAMGNVAPLGDPHVRVVGNYIYVPSMLAHLLGIYAHAVTPVRAQLRSPSLRMVFNQEISRLGLAAEPDTPQQLCDYFETPIPLMGSEPLEALIMAGAGAQMNAIHVWLGDGPVKPVKGAIRTIRADSATAPTVGVWTNVAVNFADTLPAGRYQVVGLRIVSTTAIAARLLFAGQYARPGCLGTDLISDQDAERLRYGNAGVWGEFSHDVPPTVDLLCVAADASQIFFFDLIKVA